MAGIQVGWGSQWETLANAINDYYGGGVGSVQYQQVVNMLNSGNYTVQEMDAILGNIPEFNRTYNAAGELTQVTYKAASTQGATTAGSIAQGINSNAANGTATQFQTVQTITKDAQTGKATIGDSVTKYSAGTAGSAKAIASSALWAIAAAGTGIKLGKDFSQLCYDKGWNWLDFMGVNIESLNPQSWSQITAGDDSLWAKMFNVLFLIDPVDNNPTAYIDENAFAYLAAYMGATGALDSRGYNEWDGDKPAAFTVTEPIISTSQMGSGFDVYNHPVNFYYVGEMVTDEVVPVTIGYNVPTSTDIKCTSLDINGTLRTMMTSTAPLSTTTVHAYRKDTGATVGTGSGGQSTYTYQDKTVYYTTGTYFTNWTLTHTLGTDPANDASLGQLAWVLQYGTFETLGIPGIKDQTGAKLFDTTNINDWSDINAVLTELQNQYPELWDDRIETSTDGDTTHVYIPICLPTGGTGANPTTTGAEQNKPEVDISNKGSNATDELIKTIIDIITSTSPQPGMDSDTDTPTQPPNPNVTDTGSGTTPVIVLPEGSAHALYSIYNPTQSELNSFGSWLWSSNFVDQIKKLFNDPMQSIIGLHKVFVLPPVSGRNNITVGYLDSGVSANVVSGQYVTINCGELSVSEFFHNVFDYDPYTQIYIYLPFIGIQKLDTGDVMRGKIKVVYHIDVLTGACLAEISVTRDMSGGVLYTYSGNCAVQYPLSSGSYMGIVASIASIAGGVAGTLASGGALAPMALGAISGVMNAHTRVQHSGGFSGNAGAMGSKKPYLIITRPQTAMPLNFPNYEGYPASQNTTISACNGYIKCTECHLENIPATDPELSELESLLKGGVLI